MGRAGLEFPDLPDEDFPDLPPTPSELAKRSRHAIADLEHRIYEAREAGLIVELHHVQEDGATACGPASWRRYDSRDRPGPDATGCHREVGRQALVLRAR
jgi:hypothetical protein